MSTAMIPIVPRNELDLVKNDPYEYITLFTNKYFQIMHSDPTGQVLNKFTNDQNALLAFVIMDGQVCNGGFIQLIENKYGSYIFDSPLGEYLNNWGAIKIAKILDEARLIYHQKKAILEKEKTLEEFAKLYQEHPDFEELESQYYIEVDSEKEIIKNHIQSNLSMFAMVTD